MGNSYLVYFIDKFSFERVVTALSHGEAKYKYWLSFSDAYDITFGEFLKIVRCRKVN